MADKDFNKDYLIDGDDETLRLERQALIYGFEDDLKHLSLSSKERLLDAGCGAGTITRAIARDIPNGKAIGVDREPKYIDYARRKAKLEGVRNIEFKVGDVLNLPFENDYFDVVWSKHVLQWVNERNKALAEFNRVLKPGGRIVCCNFDGFFANHFPVDAELQGDIDLLLVNLDKELGFDNLLGRKLPSMFLEEGFIDVKVDFIPDRAYGGFGGDDERRWNWDVQWHNAIGFAAKVFGSMDRALLIKERFIERFSRPDVYVFCTLFYVEGRKKT